MDYIMFSTVANGARFGDGKWLKIGTRMARYMDGQLYYFRKDDLVQP